VVLLLVFGFPIVAATMRLAYGAGISTFVTGGIGGVHRDVEQHGATVATWDVSADLTELARTPVIVVSAGIKSILDIRRTLEVLET
jgi:pseudouridylate synthase